MSRRTRARTQAAQAREGGWDLSSCRTATMPSYNALYDPNMRHYFENTTIQSHLYKTGQVRGAQHAPRRQTGRDFGAGQTGRGGRRSRKHTWLGAGVA
mmetsp:Transcript_99684/g.284959  ORF Transcript_99684/g.284959 Transcript_99684/m.284959 type:complete len:98 (-) Transcript_99684:814-1107(-)